MPEVSSAQPFPIGTAAASWYLCNWYKMCLFLFFFPLFPSLFSPLGGI